MLIKLVRLRSRSYQLRKILNILERTRMKVQKSHRFDFQKVIKWLIPIVISILAGYGFNFVIRPTEDGKTILEASFSIELADKQLPALITNLSGETEELPDVVTVDSIDGNQLAEECGETLIASKNDENLVYESVDLIFHTLLLLAYKGVEFDEILEEFERRRK